MKQIDPNHHSGQISNNVDLDTTFKYGFLKKSLVRVASWYMGKKTKFFLDFQYTQESIIPPKSNKNKKYLLYSNVSNKYVKSV